jgi:hypothetical protein
MVFYVDFILATFILKCFLLNLLETGIYILLYVYKAVS